MKCEARIVTRLAAGAEQIWLWCRDWARTIWYRADLGRRLVTAVAAGTGSHAGGQTGGQPGAPAVGCPIDAMNCVRKHLSAIKGGRLAVAAFPARLVTLLISDVPGDDPSAIASGPTVPDPTTFANARAIWSGTAFASEPAVLRHLEEETDETPKPGDPRLARTTTVTIATPQLSLEAAGSRPQGRRDTRDPGRRTGGGSRRGRQVDGWDCLFRRNPWASRTGSPCPAVRG